MEEEDSSKDRETTHSACTKINATQKRDDGSQTYNRPPLTEAVEKMEKDEGRDFARVERHGEEIF